MHGTSTPNSLNSTGARVAAFRKTESKAYPASTMDAAISKLQFHARQNTRAVTSVACFLLVLLILTSDTVRDLGPPSLRGSSSSNDMDPHWGGAVNPGYFSIEDSYVTPPSVRSGKTVFHFTAVSDMDQLSKVEGAKKPTWHSLALPGILTRTGTKEYSITFHEHRSLETQHNEAGRGAEFSELTIYKGRLLTFDDRTGDVFEVLSDREEAGKSVVVPRFIITEGDGETGKGMKWEWATVKDDQLYMGSMGKEYTNEAGEILNENNLWIGRLNAKGQLSRENWKEKYNFVREALGAAAPGYLIHEAILWSEQMKKWVFLPRRISDQQYDENEDERKGGTKAVLVNDSFTKADVVEIALEKDPLRGFSSFAFVPGTQDHHAIAIRSVEENCTGDLDVCKQRSYFVVFDVTTGEVLSDEVQYSEEFKFEGIEFAKLDTKPPVSSTT